MGSLVLKGSTVRALAHSCLDDVDESIWADGQLQWRGMSDALGSAARDNAASSGIGDI